MSDTREKLIELLDIIIQPGQKTLGDIADHLIANGVTVQKWIPVSERLPEKMEWVMCACVDGEVNILRYDHIMDDWDLFHRPNRCYKKEYVTHWMPLPDVPKGE